MKKSNFTSSFHLFSISKFAKLCFLSLSLGMLLGVWYSCKKEGQATNNVSAISISKAMEIFANSGLGETTTIARTDEEGYCGQIHINLDWKNASEYVKTEYNLSVVEVPIRHSNLTAIEMKETGQKSPILEADRQATNMLFVQDSNGNVSLSILKINGTAAYLASNQIKTNSFQSLDSDLEGRAAYYDLNDVLLKCYFVLGGNVYEMEGSSDTGHVVGASDRSYCFDHWEEKKCTSPEHHTWEDRDKCKCGIIEPNCTPPQRIAIFHECFPVLITPVSNHDGPTLPPPNNPWPSNSSGGGTGVGGTSAPAGTFGWYVNHYKSTHNNENLFATAEKAAIAWACYEDIFENAEVALTSAQFQAKFDACVEEQKACVCKGSLYSEAQMLPWHSPYGPGYTYQARAYIKEKNCKTGNSTPGCDLIPPDNGGPIGGSYEILENTSQVYSKVKTPTESCQWEVAINHRLVVKFYLFGVPVGTYTFERYMGWVII